jgi:hypothetical protein
MFSTRLARVQPGHNRHLQNGPHIIQQVETGKSEKENRFVNDSTDIQQAFSEAPKKNRGMCNQSVQVESPPAL